MTLAEGLAACDRIIELIDEDVPEHAFDKAGAFFEDVREKVASVRETIERNMGVTDRQVSALENWEDGVRKWIRE